MSFFIVGDAQLYVLVERMTKQRFEMIWRARVYNGNLDDIDRLHVGS
jgi:ribosomal protein RSM22 (predicted rRNA methylase)